MSLLPGYNIILGETSITSITTSSTVNGTTKAPSKINYDYPFNIYVNLIYVHVCNTYTTMIADSVNIREDSDLVLFQLVTVRETRYQQTATSRQDGDAKLQLLHQRLL